MQARFLKIGYNVEKRKNTPEINKRVVQLLESLEYLLTICVIDNEFYHFINAIIS